MLKGQYGIRVLKATELERLPTGHVWAVWVWHVKLKREELINLYELEQWNSKEDVSAVVSCLISGLSVRSLFS